MAVIKYKDGNGNYIALTNYTVQPITPVQSTGTSTTEVMSQNAVTTELGKKANSSDVYTKTEANNSFITKTDASSTYLSKTDASSTYATKTEVSNTYLSKTDASNTYQTSQQVQNIVNNVVYGDADGGTGTVVTTQNLATTLSGYQPKLTAGTGISIENNTVACTLDTSLYQVVSSLPSTGAANKIYLVSNGTSGTQNVYTEYAYVSDKWEKMGEYKADVDLTPYLKSADASTTYLSKTDAASTYATKTDASTTYLSKTDASNTYLSKTSASSAYAAKATTLAGYGITDAKIEDGVITLGTSTITPLTAHPDTSTLSGNYGPTANVSGANGNTIVVPQITVDSNGHVTGVTNRTYTSVDTVYTHPGYTATTGVPTAAATPGFGGTFNVNQITTDATGHVTANTSRQITIPSAVATSSANGLMSSTDKAWLDFMNGASTSTTISAVPVNKHFCVLTISANGTFALASTPAAGREIHIVVKNSSTSDRTITLPDASPYVNMSSDSLTVPASGYADINILSDGTNMYLRAL